MPKKQVKLSPAVKRPALTPASAARIRSKLEAVMGK